MRKEADDIGPRAELDHWKKRMSKFNYLLDQIKSHDVKTVLGILQTAKSKSIKVQENSLHFQMNSFSGFSIIHEGEETKLYQCYCYLLKLLTNIFHFMLLLFNQVWQELDRRITDSANEAKDNVKYLYTLEKFSDPLYHSDPVGMLEGIPGLINAIRMIHSISRYYNTSERMTSLFVKVCVTFSKFKSIRGAIQIYSNHKLIKISL